MKVQAYIYSVFIAVVLMSCGETQSKDNNQKRVASIVSDSLIEQSCVADASNTYWYYAPEKSLDSGAIMIFFDSHGNGKFPLEKYKRDAIARNCIFIGSNALKNGLLPNEQKYLIGILLDDIRVRFLDKKRSIYLCGFSGGARTASRLAAENAIFSGVIANGAPINPQDAVQNTEMTYIAVVGTADFNLLEVMLTENMLKTAPFKHYLLTHPGKHEWMSLDYFRLAFDILESKQNAQYAVKCKKSIDTLLNTAKRKKDIEQQAALLQIASSILNTDPIKAKYLASLDSLFKLQNTKDALQKQSELYNNEMKQQDEYVQHYAQKDYQWWKSELKTLANKAKPETVEGASAKRLLAFINMIGYVYVDKSLNQNALTDADKFLKLYHLSDSSNPDVYYLRAKYFVYSNQKALVIPQLKLCQEYGYDDAVAMQSEPAFAQFKTDTAFQNILKLMSEKKAK